MRLLTNLLFEPKGMHNQNAAYNIKDTVMSGDGSKVYFAIQDVPAGIPLNDSNYWKLQIDLSGSKSAMDQALASFADYAKVISMRVRGETAKTSGNPVTFLPDAGSLLQPVTVLEPQQQGSGDPSPSNIRPIIGYNALGLNHTGKNLLSKVDIVGDIFLKSLVRLKAGETYTLSVQKMPDALYFSNEGGSVEFAMNTGSMSLTYTAETTGGYSVLARYGSGASVGYNMQLEHSSAPGAYAPYQGKNHTVQIGQTVYGGRFDWLTGKLVAEWSGHTFDGTEAFDSMEMVGENTGRVFYTPDPYGEQTPNTDIGNLKCDRYKSVSYNTLYSADVPCVSLHTSGQIAIRPQFTTVDDFKVYLAAQYAAGTPVQIAYKLANPIEIQLAPHIISAADPEQTNTLYGDGRIDVEYVKPLHVSIEEHVAAAVAAAMQT